MYRKPALLLAITMGIAASLSAQNAFTLAARKSVQGNIAYAFDTYPRGDAAIRFPSRMKTGCGSSYGLEKWTSQPAQVTSFDFSIAREVVPPEFRGKTIKIRFEVPMIGASARVSRPKLSDSTFAKALQNAVSGIRAVPGLVDGCTVAGTVTKSVKLP